MLFNMFSADRFDFYANSEPFLADFSIVATNCFCKIYSNFATGIGVSLQFLAPRHTHTHNKKLKIHIIINKIIYPRYTLYYNI